MRFSNSAVFVVTSLMIASATSQQPWPPSPHVASTPPLAPAEQKEKFHLPPGFEIELVAAEPQINKPINIAFDAKGRLWVTGSVEYPYAAKPGQKPRDKVWVLSDFGPDGKAGKVEVFADELNIPIGVLPLADCKSALVYSIPNIYKLTDTDGDGKADKKEVLYSGYGFADTHGMTGEFTWGLDGWIYCCHGYANTSKVKSKEDKLVTMTSGNTYRIKPDGSKIEQWTWGQVNPFGLAFDSLGNLYSTDCHTRPLYQLLRGAYYPSFGKAHDGLGFGPEMVTHDHGSTAICGIACYEADQYPKEFHGNLFVGNVITNRINRDRIEWHGSTPKGIEMPDLVKCDDPWFRPVDIKLGPDGCLYVADFYNRIIGHYEVPLDHPGRDREKGRIWRIVYRGKDGKGGPPPIADLTKASPKELLDGLKNPNLEVRTQATNQLVTRSGDKATSVLEKRFDEGSPEQQVHALWVLQRLGKLDDHRLTAQLNSKNRAVRVHALRVLSERARWPNELHDLAIELLKDIDPFVQRAAGEALGSAPSTKNIFALLEARHSVPAKDTHLLHVVRMALRDQFKGPKLSGALRFLGKGKNLEEKELRAVADICLGLPQSEAGIFLMLYLPEIAEPLPQFERLVRHMVRHSGLSLDVMDLPKMFEKSLADDYAGQAIVLKAALQAGHERGANLESDLSTLAEVAANHLLAGGTAHLHLGAELAGLFRIASTLPDLKRMVVNPKLPDEARKQAVSALAAIDMKRNGALLAALLIQDTEAPAVREHAAKILAMSSAPAAQKAVIQALEKAPAATQTVIALSLAGSPQGGERLLDAVAQGKASARLLQDKAVEARLRQAKVANLDQRLAKLTKGLPAADQRLHELIVKKRDAFDLAKADKDRGLKVFTKHCAACHQIANQGSKIGPQLDGIGIRGLDRLLEDVLDSNRNVDQAFRATTLVLNNGQLVTGLFLRQDGKVLVMADNLGKEVRVDSADVQDRLVAQVSPMPSNFAEQIGAAEFNDLMAYLLAQRVKD